MSFEWNMRGSWMWCSQGGICALETLWFGLGLRDHLLTTLLLLLQGSIFWRTGVDNEESFWDVVEDAKFEVKEPEAKKSKKEEEEEEEEWSSVEFLELRCCSVLKKHNYPTSRSVTVCK